MRLSETVSDSLTEVQARFLQDQVQSTHDDWGRELLLCLHSLPHQPGIVPKVGLGHPLIPGQGNCTVPCPTMMAQNL